MTKLATTNQELAIATEILRPLLGEWPAEVVDDDAALIHFRLRGTAGRLQSVVFSRTALRNLASDPLRAVKIEYLQRDMARAAATRREYRYPRFAAAAVPAPIPFPSREQAAAAFLESRMTANRSATAGC